MDSLRAHLLAGAVIPAHPLALTAGRAIDERRQRALTRYYMDAGAGGVAVGVHTTQFAIRVHGMLRDVLTLAAETARDWRGQAVRPFATDAQRPIATDSPRPFTLIAGVVGERRQALDEAALAQSLGFDAVLLSLAGLDAADDAALVDHCRAVAEVIPVIGFYLQPAVGGRLLGAGFWRRFAEIPRVVAIKVAPFNRYQTLDVIRAVVESGRDDVALYTGNDDNIIADLLTPFSFGRDGGVVTRQFAGGLLGQWAVWTRGAVAMLNELRALRGAGVGTSGTVGDCVRDSERDSERGTVRGTVRGSALESWLSRGAALTDANAAIFDAANGFAGCIAGIHEVLRRQGLMAGTWCLDPSEGLSPGQADALDRVWRDYPWLRDDDFVAEGLERWLR
ncbi:MAG: dihydrodipicolinate synthase family protein [Gemmatimonadota bacterium]